MSIFDLFTPDIDRLVTKQDIKGLIAALHHDAMDIRWLAAGGLGELRDAAAVEPLIALLKDSDPEVRWKAAEALGSIGDIQATAALLPFLSDSDGAMRLQVIWALGKVRDPRATPHIIRSLSDTDHDLRVAAIWALGAIGDREAITTLKELLLDRDYGIRSKAAESLEMCRWRPADGGERALLAFANRDWRELSRNRIHALDILIWALKDEYFATRMNAARILGEMRSNKAVLHLKRALDDPEECVSYEAAAALAEIGSKEAKLALVHGLESRFLVTRKETAGALERFHWKPPDTYHAVLFLSAKEDWVGLVRLKGAGIDPLAQEFEEREGAVRTSIGEALKIAGDLATESLIRLLKGPDPDVRRRAASLLGDIRDKRAVEALISALADIDDHVSGNAALSLGKIGDARAVNPLGRWLIEGGPALRRSSVTALGRLRTCRSLEAILAACRDEDSTLRLNAIQSMGRIRNARVVPALLAFLQDAESEPRLEAVRALRPYPGPETIDALITALKDPDAGVRREASAMLGIFAAETATLPLIGCLDDPDTGVQLASAKALDSLGWSPDSPEAQLSYLMAKEDWKEVMRLGLLKRPSPEKKSAPTILIPEAGSGPAEILLRERLSSDGNRPATTAGNDGNSSTGKDEELNLEYFVSTLNDPQKPVTIRQKAAEALGGLGDIRGVGPLMEALRDPYPGVRWRAALSLGMLGDHRAVDPLVAALTDPAFDVKKRAAEALAVLKSRSAVAPLCAVAASPDPGSRTLAVTVLGAFEDDDALRTLLSALGDPDPAVQSASSSSLLRLAGYWKTRAAALLKDDDPVIRVNTLAALKSILGEETAALLLVPLLQENHFAIRREAALALERLGWRPGAPDEEATVLIAHRRWDDLAALGTPGQRVLIDALFDQEREIQQGAIATLGTIGDDETIGSIKSAMRVKGQQVKGLYAAMKAISLIKDRQERDEPGEISDSADGGGTDPDSINPHPGTSSP